MQPSALRPPVFNCDTSEARCLKSMLSENVPNGDTGDPVLSVPHYAIGMDHTGHFRNSGELMDAANLEWEEVS